MSDDEHDDAEFRAVVRLLAQTFVAGVFDRPPLTSTEARARLDGLDALAASLVASPEPVGGEAVAAARARLAEAALERAAGPDPDVARLETLRDTLAEAVSADSERMTYGEHLRAGDDAIRIAAVTAAGIDDTAATFPAALAQITAYSTLALAHYAAAERWSPA